MFKNEQTSSESCDEYIREYAFEPELLINRDEFRKQEQQNRSAAGLVSVDSGARLDDEDTVPSFQRRVSNEMYNEYKNKVEIEIEAFYYVSVNVCLYLCMYVD